MSEDWTDTEDEINAAVRYVRRAFIHSVVTDARIHALGDGGRVVVIDVSTEATVYRVTVYSPGGVEPRIDAVTELSYDDILAEERAALAAEEEAPKTVTVTLTEAEYHTIQDALAYWSVGVWDQPDEEEVERRTTTASNTLGAALAKEHQS
jgi:hypothetical protein